MWVGCICVCMGERVVICCSGKNKNVCLTTVELLLSRCLGLLSI